MTDTAETIYAIGDVHGRNDLLAPLVAAIREDAAPNGGTPRIVFLGDIIDRGPQSRQALDCVIETLETCPGSRLILGNHEEFLLRFLDDAAGRERIADLWFRNGGIATLASFGIGVEERVDAIARRFADEYPRHVAALRAADWRVEAGRYLLVHGGIDPHRALEEQEPQRTRWIRNEFLEWPHPLPRVVVHGHTVTPSYMPEIHANRIALDTGAFRTGRLTCGVFDPASDRIRFMAAQDRDGDIGVGEIRHASETLLP